MPRLWPNRAPLSPRFLIAAAFFLFVFVLGGGSRGDIASLAVLRAVSAFAFVVFLAGLSRQDFADFRWPVGLGLAALLLTGLHMVPLPPDAWRALPGRDLYAEIDAAAGIGEIWRPLSIAPPRTSNAFFSLLVPLAAMFALIRLDLDERRRILGLIVGLGMISAMFGLLQVAGGRNSPLYFYDVTNYGSAVGLFSNRNHQAAFLATLFPMLAVLASRPAASFEQTRFRMIVCGSIAVLLVPLLLVTGSRGGVLWGLVGAAAGLLLFRSPLGLSRPLRRGANKVPIGLVAGGMTVAAVTAVVGLLSARGESLSRLAESGTTGEIRAETFRPVLALALDNLPLGTGLGTFVEAYQRVEPDAMLTSTYLNHAHDDFLELLVTGGIPAIVLAVTGIAWTALATLRVWRASAEQPGRRMALAGAVVIMILAAASVVDYPLRTPALACLLATAAVWLSGGMNASARQQAGRGKLGSNSI